MSSKRRRNKHTTSQPFDREVSAIEFQELAGFLGIDYDDDLIALDPWLLTKVQEAGLWNGLGAAIEAGGYEGMVAFLQLHGLADQGGYRDVRKK